MVKNIMVPDDPSMKAKQYWEKRNANKQYDTWS